MNTLDYIVIGLYLAGTLAAGMVFARRIRDSKDMFVAGGQSPWWVSGLSGFMTMFSAGTFVVWGGIAYRYGAVAIAINLCYGVAALLVGWTLAARWKRLGVSSAVEFLQLRFGPSIVQFYTWLNGTIMIFGSGGMVYALSKIICALVPLPEGHILADPATGHLSVTIMSLALCFAVTLISFVGGLWAVLMTDVLQFIIIMVSVVFVVPLILMRVGGIGGFIEGAPEGFFNPVADDFTWWFLAGWVLVHYFKIGGDWAFVQRYHCVPTPTDARRSAYIFAAMYVLSPLFWMLPPMAYRLINPNADYEQAYILACQAVLPVGMVGLMVAAMMSATASALTSSLNVSAQAFATEVYRRWLRPDASERRVVFVGRGITAVLGAIVASGAILIPLLGTYTGYILAMTGLIIAPLALPTIWGLFSKRLSIHGIWAATLVGFSAGVLVKFGLGGPNAWFAGIGWLQPLNELVSANIRVTDLTVGTIAPLLTLIVAELVSRQTQPGWHVIQSRRAEQRTQVAPPASLLPARMVACTCIAIGGVIGIVGAIDRSALLLTSIFAAALLALGGLILLVAHRMERAWQTVARADLPVTVVTAGS